MTNLIKTIFIASILLIGTNRSVAQSVVPGFRGKRLFVEGNFACLPLLAVGPTLENTGVARYSPNPDEITPTGFPISWRTGGTIHYITGRKTSLFLGFQHFKTGMKSNAFSQSVGLPAPTEIINYDKHFLFSALTVNALELGVELNTGKGMLAPMGAYTRWSVQYYTMSASLLDKYTFYGNGADGSLGHRALGIDNVNTWDIGVGLEFGSRRMIAKNTMLTLGIRSNTGFMFLFGERITSDSNRYTDSGAATAVLQGYKDGDIRPVNQRLAISAARDRNFAHGLLMLNVGIGYLIK